MNHVIIQGDARRLPLADKLVHVCITSPPYFGLRDYGTATWVGGSEGCDHKVRPTHNVTSSTLGGGKKTSGHWQEGYSDACGKCGARRVDRQIGLEATPDEFVASMVRVFREVKRVLRDDGVCFLNIGDSMGTGKQLLMMPHRVALALQADGWIVRMDVVWAKPNPMPECVTDRPTKSHEYLFLLTKRERYYWDAEAVREGVSGGAHARGRNGIAAVHPKGEISEAGKVRSNASFLSCMEKLPDEAGRNIRSVWSIPTESWKGSHFATYPRKLVEPCVKAGTSERGCCPTCGAPWERVTEVSPEYRAILDANKGQGNHVHGSGYTDCVTDGSRGGVRSKHGGLTRSAKTTGWRPTCTCYGHLVTIEPDDDDIYARPINVYVLDRPLPEPVPCTVLDPFAGSGTTGVVATALNRRFVGVELSPDYARMAVRRIDRPHARHESVKRDEEFTLPGLS